MSAEDSKANARRAVASVTLGVLWSGVWYPKDADPIDVFVVWQDGDKLLVVTEDHRLSSIDGKHVERDMPMPDRGRR